jgi:hypothetical protein
VEQLNADFSERDPDSWVEDCGNPTMGGREGMDLLFAFDLIPFVSRPDSGQIVFKKRARRIVTKTFFNALFERVQTIIFVLFIENANQFVDAPNVICRLMRLMRWISHFLAPHDRRWSEIADQEPTCARTVRSSWKSIGLVRWKSNPASLLRLMSSSLSNPVRATPLTGCFRLA